MSMRVVVAPSTILSCPHVIDDILNGLRKIIWKTIVNLLDQNYMEFISTVSI